MIFGFLPLKTNASETKNKWPAGTWLSSTVRFHCLVVYDSLCKEYVGDKRTGLVINGIIQPIKVFSSDGPYFAARLHIKHTRASKNRSFGTVRLRYDSETDGFIRKLKRIGELVFANR